MSRTVLVTGASRGIGRAIALHIGSKGYTVVVHYVRNQEAAESALAELVANGGSGRLLAFDISNREQTRQAIEVDIAEHGAYYGVICNAGIAADNSFPIMEGVEWDSVIHTNLDGFYNVLQPVIMPMVSARMRGRIITLSSISGLVGNRGQVNYSAAKAGIIGATKALALELARHKITVNCIAPGIIETDMTRDLPLDEIKKLIPMRRLGNPQEVASLATYLLSEDAGYITRQAISVNGGLV